MTQCREGMTLENGAFLCCPQQVEDHRKAHGPFTFWFHYTQDSTKTLGWPEVKKPATEGRAQHPPCDCGAPCFAFALNKKTVSECERDHKAFEQRWYARTVRPSGVPVHACVECGK